MYHNDHAPPHFHAIYGGAEAEIDIETLQIVHGELPPRVRALVAEWASQHQDELQENWRRARRHLPLRDVEPLT